MCEPTSGISSLSHPLPRPQVLAPKEPTIGKVSRKALSELQRPRRGICITPTPQGGAVLSHPISPSRDRHGIQDIRVTFSPNSWKNSTHPCSTYMLLQSRKDGTPLSPPKNGQEGKRPWFYAGQTTCTALTRIAQEVRLSANGAGAPQATGQPLLVAVMSKYGDVCAKVTPCAAPRRLKWEEGTRLLEGLATDRRSANIQSIDGVQPGSSRRCVRKVIGEVPLRRSPRLHPDLAA